MDRGGDHGDGDDASSLMKWMDQQQSRTVIYVALGTQAHFCWADQVALALALEKVGFPVVWAMKNVTHHNPIDPCMLAMILLDAHP